MKKSGRLFYTKLPTLFHGNVTDTKVTEKFGKKSPVKSAVYRKDAVMIPI
jgi:hypothetical protein